VNNIVVTLHSLHNLYFVSTGIVLLSGLNSNTAAWRPMFTFKSMHYCSEYYLYLRISLFSQIKIYIFLIRINLYLLFLNLALDF